MPIYIVATPIGNLGDISERAIETLKSVDLIAAEDTRHSRKLLQHFDIETPMISLHEHNEKIKSEKIFELIEQGKSVAIISDAGTPLVSDPGYPLVHEAQERNIDVIPIPGPCAAITALSASGLPSDRFIFEGFLSAKQNARIKKLEEFLYETRTMIFYESPHRILEALKDMRTVFGDDRYVVVARELTKLYETIHGDSLDHLIQWMEEDPHQQAGEFVVLITGVEKVKTDSVAEEDEKILKILLEELSVKQASQLAAKITGKKKNILYEMALGLENK